VRSLRRGYEENSEAELNRALCAASLATVGLAAFENIKIIDNKIIKQYTQKN
jgi:hypothetical protein